jgi:hypothetical protein
MSTEPAKETVMRPPHYARWPIEPSYFIIANDLDKARGDIIKRIMRWQDKDGLIDLYKAIRDLDMYTTYQEEKSKNCPVELMQFHAVPSLLQVLLRHVKRSEAPIQPAELKQITWWVEQQERKIAMQSTSAGVADE